MCFWSVGPEKEHDEDGMKAFFDVMDERGSEDEVFERLEMAWGRLKEVDRKILESYYVDGCRMDVIAKRIGYRNGNSVKSRKNKVIRRMMKMMHEETDFGGLPLSA